MQNASFKRITVGPRRGRPAVSSTSRTSGSRSRSDVRFYLQLHPRQLPSRFLYDALGSALFDAICHLPWYRITRAELQLLRQHAGTIGQHSGEVDGSSNWGAATARSWRRC